MDNKPKDPAKESGVTGYYPKTGDEFRFYLKHLIQQVQAADHTKQDVIFKGGVKMHDRETDKHGYNPGSDVEVYESDDPPEAHWAPISKAKYKYYDDLARKSVKKAHSILTSKEGKKQHMAAGKSSRRMARAHQDHYLQHKDEHNKLNPGMEIESVGEIVDRVMNRLAEDPYTHYKNPEQRTGTFSGFGKKSSMLSKSKSKPVDKAEQLKKNILDAARRNDKEQQLRKEDESVEECQVVNFPKKETHDDKVQRFHNALTGDKYKKDQYPAHKSAYPKEVSTHSGGSEILSDKGDVLASFSKKDYGVQHFKHAQAHFKSLVAKDNKMKNEALDFKAMKASGTGDKGGRTKDSDFHRDAKTDVKDQYGKPLKVGERKKPKVYEGKSLSAILRYEDEITADYHDADDVIKIEGDK